MSTEPNKVIYSMVGVSKFYDKKPVLKDIYLSYFYGAKIGVIGLNGSGKSSLLRIMAGVDKEINGEAVLSPGYTVGYLEQEPLIDDGRTVRQVIEEAVQETVKLLKEFEEINAKFAETMSDDDMNKLLERQGEVQEKLDHLAAVLHPRSNRKSRPCNCRSLSRRRASGARNAIALNHRSHR